MPTDVKFLRIDDRLIHGQVIVGWLPVLETTHLLVANERIAADPMRQDMMGLSVPPEVTLLFASPQNLGQISRIVPATLVLVASPRDAWTCLQSGLNPARCNVGGMHAKPGKTEVREALHIDDEDRRYFELILKSGIVPLFQPTPQNEPLSLSEIL